MTNKDFFFSYDITLKNYLHRKGFRYLTHGLSPKTHDDFFMYERSDELQQEINNYIQIKSNS